MKIRTLFRSPLETQSGYGCHSRQIFQALYNDPLFDLSCESINWGQCSYVTYPIPEIKKCIEKYMIAKHSNNENWDLFIDLSIPNEFSRRGKFNIGVSAIVETDRVSHVWIEKCNQMDLIIVPSEHSRDVLCKTIVDWQNPQGQTGQLRFTKPIVVCPEGVNPSYIKWTEEPLYAKDFYDKLNIESDFNFLCVGQWGNGGYGEDRKNIALTVKYFIEEFRGRKDVGLVLKTNMVKNSVMDYMHIKLKLAEIKSNYKSEEVPPIYLVHGSLSENEMAALYNHPKIKALISLTHGEGYGLPLLEAAACDLPVMATNWSGHLDFLKLGKFIPLEYEMKEIPGSAVWQDVMIKGSQWANVKENDVKERMRKIVSSYDKPKEWAKDLGQKIRDNFSLKNVSEVFLMTVKQNILKETAAQINPKEHLASFVDTPDSYNVVYVMPMSAGDVFVSTAVIDGLKKELPEDHKIYFVTQPQYADILKGNPNVYKIIPWNETMIHLELLEDVFDLALTPNIATHYNFSNWVRRGQGRLLAEEYANHCQSELGDYYIEKDDSILKSSVEMKNGLSTFLCNPYMTIHTTSGKGQWEGRRYDDWQEILNNLKDLYPELMIVQVGGADEPELKNVDVDLRGKTNYQQLACVLEKSMLHLSPDTFSMHLSAALNVPLVALFGCSYAASTGPWVKNKEKAKYILLQSERLTGCRDKACYKNKCAKNPENPPINEIDPKEVFQACEKLLREYE